MGAKTPDKIFGGQPGDGICGGGAGAFTPPIAGGSTPILSPVPSCPRWQRERSRRICRILRCIDKRVAAGKSLHTALVYFNWAWKGRHYKVAPERPLPFSPGNLTRLYYRWIAGGRTPETLVLGYRRGPRKVLRDDLLLLVGWCLRRETRSFSQGYRRLQLKATESAYRYAIPAPLWKSLVATFATRRAADRRERAARRLLKEFSGLKAGQNAPGRAAESRGVLRPAGHPSDAAPCQLTTS